MESFLQRVNDLLVINSDQFLIALEKKSIFQAISKELLFDVILLLIAIAFFRYLAYLRAIRAKIGVATGTTTEEVKVFKKTEKANQFSKFLRAGLGVSIIAFSIGFIVNGIDFAKGGFTERAFVKLEQEYLLSLGTVQGKGGNPLEHLTYEQVKEKYLAQREAVREFLKKEVRKQTELFQASEEVANWISEGIEKEAERYFSKDVNRSYFEFLLALERYMDKKAENEEMAIEIRGELLQAMPFELKEQNELVQFFYYYQKQAGSRIRREQAEASSYSVFWH